MVADGQIGARLIALPPCLLAGVAGRARSRFMRDPAVPARCLGERPQPAPGERPSSDEC